MKFKEYDLNLQQQLGQVEIPNTLIGYFYPNQELITAKSFAETTPDDLRSIPIADNRNAKLAFSNGDRHYLADPTSDIDITDLYPNPSDAIAYGSLLATPCRSGQEFQSLKVWVIDDETGENGGQIDNEEAKDLVGDCYGRISYQLAQDVMGDRDREKVFRKGEYVPTPFQHRLGIKPQIDSSVARVAKGTLAPDSRMGLMRNLSSTEAVLEGIEVDTGRTKHLLNNFDLVLPTSSFKGRKGKESNAIEPGVYQLDVYIGVKQIAYYGKQSLGVQFLGNFSESVRNEIGDIAEEKAEFLQKAQGSLPELARLYIESYKELKELRKNGDQAVVDFDESVAFDTLDSFINMQDALPTNKPLNDIRAELIEKDLEHNQILLEHPFIVSKLKEFLKNQWADIAEGRVIKFQSAMAQPSSALAEDEVCSPIHRNGERLIVTRSPIINANGIVIFTNKHVEALMKEKNHGVIYMNSKAALDNLQADFDGDRLAFDRASKYPTLEKEIEEHHKPENKYPPIIKKAKVPYQGDLEVIALDAAKLYIGPYANVMIKAKLAEEEINYIPEELRNGYLNNIHVHYTKLSKAYKPIQVDTAEEREWLDQQKEHIDAIATIPREKIKEEETKILGHYRNILRLNIALAGDALQIAADGPKSALRPDEAKHKHCKSVLGHIKRSWLYDKKERNIYLDRPLLSDGHSPIDHLIRITNKHWENAQIEAVPSLRFRNIFPEPTPEHQQFAQDIRSKTQPLRQQIRELIEKENKYPEVAFPYGELTSEKSGKTLHITNISSDKRVLEKLETEQFSVTFQPDNSGYHLWAHARFSDNSTSPIGRVMPADLVENPISENTQIKQAIFEIKPPITKYSYKTLYDQRDKLNAEIRESIPQEDKAGIAAAMWHANFSKKRNETQIYNYGTDAFSLFHSEISKQLEVPPREHTLLGVQDISTYSGRLDGAFGKLEIVKGGQFDWQKKNDPGSRYAVLDGHPIGKLSSEHHNPLPGKIGYAYLTAASSSSAILTTNKGTELKVDRILQNDFSQAQWNGERADVTLQMRQIKGRPVATVHIGPKTLGELSKGSIEVLHATKAFKDKSSLTFPVKIDLAPPTKVNMEIIRPSKDPVTIEQRKDNARYHYLRMLQTVNKEAPILGQVELDRIIGENLYQQHGSDKRKTVREVIGQSNTVKNMKKFYGHDEARFRQEALSFIQSIEEKSLVAQVER